jgi:hypothetical protein
MSTPSAERVVVPFCDEVQIFVFDLDEAVTFLRAVERRKEILASKWDYPTNQPDAVAAGPEELVDLIRGFAQA